MSFVPFLLVSNIFVYSIIGYKQIKGSEKNIKSYINKEYIINVPKSG